MNVFNVGDVVILNSDSIKMTVEEVRVDEVDVVYMDPVNGLSRDTFNPNILSKYTPTPPPIIRKS